MILSQVFNPKAINIHLESEDKDEVFEELIEELVGINPNFNRRAALEAVQKREAKMSTGIMPSIAVPHGKTDTLTDVKGVIGISRKGIDYDALDGKPVHLVILLLSGTNCSEFHLRVLRRLSRILSHPGFYPTLLEQKTSEDVYDLVCKYEEQLN